MTTVNSVDLRSSATPIGALTVKSGEKRDGCLGGSFHPSQPNELAGIAIRKVSPDGKVLTITDEGTNRKGEKFSQVLVFDRELGWGFR